MSELSVGDKVIFKRDGFYRGPILLFDVIRVFGRSNEVRVQDEQRSYRFPKTSLIKVGSYE